MARSIPWRPDGTNVQRLTQNEFGESGSIWSPDGDKIAFTSDIDGDDDIYIMNADGSDVKQITDNPQSDWYPIWSPDGEKLLFTYDKWSLYMVNADGSDQRILVDKHDSGNADWSPDGRKIAYAAEISDNGDIYILTLKKHRVKRITFD